MDIDTGCMRDKYEKLHNTYMRANNNNRYETLNTKNDHMMWSIFFFFFNLFCWC